MNTLEIIVERLGQVTSILLSMFFFIVHWKRKWIRKSKYLLELFLYVFELLTI